MLDSLTTEEMQDLQRQQAALDEEMRLFQKMQDSHISEAVDLDSVRMRFAASEVARLEAAIKKVNSQLEVEHQARIESEKSAKQQKSIDRNRFIINLLVTIVSAVAAVVAAVVAIIALA